MGWEAEILPLNQERFRERWVRKVNHEATVIFPQNIFGTLPVRRRHLFSPVRMADDTTLTRVLARAELAHLSAVLQSCTFAELASLERAQLLAQLKALGVDKLGDRQKAATAIAKAVRSPQQQEGDDDGGGGGVSVRSLTTAHDDIAPQGFSIYCHNTTLSDGTQLNNSEPAPEFIIAELEKRTGVKRPANAATCSLHDLNLHFMAGG